MVYLCVMRARGRVAKSRRQGALQQEQLALFKQKGGKRRGAGRPPTGHRSGSPHKTREVLNPRYPVHVTLRVVSEIGRLRRKASYHAIRQATVTAAAGRIRIVHVSIQGAHLHLLVEGKNKRLLAAGLQGFQVSAAKYLNAAFGKMTGGPARRGTVFPDRYHAEIVTSPTQARRALSYLLLNWRKHREDMVAPMNQWMVDWFSSSAMFPDWAEYGDEAFLWRGPPTYEPLWVWRPRTWLLAEGWKKLGSTISCYDVPSSREMIASA